MEYNMTVERTLRIAITFEAENDKAAEEKANELFVDMIEHPEKFEGGDKEHDYALCADGGRTVVDWS